MTICYIIYPSFCAVDYTYFAFYNPLVFASRIICKTIESNARKEKEHIHKSLWPHHDLMVINTPLK